VSTLRLTVAAALAVVCLAAVPAPLAAQWTVRPPTAAQVLHELNAVRARKGRPPLRMSKALTAAAKFHTSDMGRKGYFSHTSKDGTSFWKRLRRFYPTAGYRSWAAGENILWSSATISAGRAVDLWMHSPGHRANILNRSWREVGIAAQTFTAAPGVFRGLTVTIVTTDFGIRR
jgi:uncharacterized protein YkwD